MRLMVFILSLLVGYWCLKSSAGNLSSSLWVIVASWVMVFGLFVWSKLRTHGHISKSSCYYGILVGGVLLASALLLFQKPSQFIAMRMHKVVYARAGDMLPQLQGNEDGEKSNELMESGGSNLLTDDVSRELPKRSNINPKGHPEVFLRFKNGAEWPDDKRIYLRSYALEQYREGRWSMIPLANHKQFQPEAGRESITLNKTPANRAQFAALDYRIYHSVNDTGRNAMISMNGLTRVWLPSLTQLANDVYQLPTITENRYSYRQSAKPLDVDDLLEAQLEMKVPAAAEPWITEVPAVFHEDIDYLVAQWRHLPLGEALMNLKEMLQRDYQYSLRTENVDDREPIENFLFYEKSGYCEHFASATALICRRLGIPSRVAYGWSGGTYYPEQDLWLFRARDAHAWTELWFEGYGWVSFDTTPVSSENVPTPSVAPEGEQAPEPEEFDYNEADEDAEPADDDYLPSEPTVDLVLVLAGVVLLLALVIVIHRRKDIRIAVMPAFISGRPAERSYLHRFAAECAKLGMPMDRGRTLRRQLELIERAGIKIEFASDLLAYHYETNYAGRERDASYEKQLAKRIAKWARERAAKS
ncbi:transglutaminase-like domain-containing protein [Persicirhabdus sediminis]|uniref:transglutaminase-like domain-containing protein n=1 Tax=Persicirhabdus sediminis TaxID=454144 RepID=UPI001F1C20E2|nr:transglutaminase-like domain-containing protein [Persicirhabdus sediminis]